VSFGGISRNLLSVNVMLATKFRHDSGFKFSQKTEVGCWFGSGSQSRQAQFKLLVTDVSLLLNFSSRF